ncbi:hypothetical protein ACFQO4_00620 [Saliphagus sp. GCM10025334]
MGEPVPDSMQPVTTSSPTARDQHRYLVLASPQEVPVDVDGAYDSVICLGDLLRFAPPPGRDPDGSVVAQFAPTVERAYETGATEPILESIRSLVDRRDVRRVARERYDEYFGTFETDVYFLAGNQDIPDALAAAADAHDHVAHASALPETCAIDGAVPSFAPFPSDTFPGECPRDEFYRRLDESDASVLLTHTLPAEFDAGEYGFKLALAGRDDGSVSDLNSNAVVELPPYPDEVRTVQLTMRVTKGGTHLRVESAPAQAISDYDNT